MASLIQKLSDFLSKTEINIFAHDRGVLDIQNCRIYTYSVSDEDDLLISKHISNEYNESLEYYNKYLEKSEKEMVKYRTKLSEYEDKMREMNIQKEKNPTAFDVYIDKPDKPYIPEKPELISVDQFRKENPSEVPEDLKLYTLGFRFRDGEIIGKKISTCEISKEISKEDPDSTFNGKYITWVRVLLPRNATSSKLIEMVKAFKQVYFSIPPHDISMCYEGIDHIKWKDFGYSNTYPNIYTSIRVDYGRDGYYYSVCYKDDNGEFIAVHADDFEIMDIINPDEYVYLYCFPYTSDEFVKKCFDVITLNSAREDEFRKRVKEMQDEHSSSSNTDDFGTFMRSVPSITLEPENEDTPEEEQPAHTFNISSPKANSPKSGSASPAAPIRFSGRTSPKYQDF